MNNKLNKQELVNNTFNNIEEPKSELSTILFFIIVNKWTIIFIMLITISAGMLYRIIASPIYKSNSLVQVEDNSVEGGENKLDDLSNLFTGKTPAETEIEIIKSRSVIGKAIDEQNLNIIVKPTYFPIIGKAISRYYSGDKVATPILGLSKYSWGGETLKISSLSVPQEYESQEEELKLISGAKGSYKLYSPDNQLLLTGHVGQTATSLSDNGKKISILVTELKANIGTTFKIKKIARIEAIKELEKEVFIKEKGKQTGIIEIAMEGENPLLNSAIINSITDTYIRQNIQRKSVEAQKKLEFLDSQIPMLKRNLEQAEQSLTSYQTAHMQIDPTIEIQGYVNELSEIDKNIMLSRMQLEDIKTKFTPSHPEFQALNQKIYQLNASKMAILQKIKNLPLATQYLIRLQRNVKVANDLYLLVLNRAEELKVIKAGTVGNVRVLDPAVNEVEPEFPKTGVILGFSFALGMTICFLFFVSKKQLDRKVYDANLIENKTGVPVLATIAHSSKQTVQIKALTKGKSNRLYPLAITDKSDLSIEGIRNLRTTLLLSSAAVENKILVIMGPSPNIGKSYITVNLAELISDTNKSVLLMDSDLRKGYLNKYYGLERNPGLSDLLLGRCKLEETIHKINNSNVHVITAGSAVSNPSELLSGKEFKRVIDTLSAKYDVVLIDTPPILAVTDGIAVAKEASFVCLVVKAGHNNMGEINVAIKRLRQNEIELSGIVLNDIRLDKMGYAYQDYGYYQYDYKK